MSVEDFVIHELRDGTEVAVCAMHDAIFSDGTKCQGSPWDAVRKLSCVTSEERVGLYSVKTTFALSSASLHVLDELCNSADIVWVPRPVLQALRDMGLRDAYGAQVLGMNSTPESHRSDQKIVDISRWAW